MLSDDVITQKQNAGGVAFSEPHGAAFADVNADNIPDFIVSSRYSGDSPGALKVRGASKDDRATVRVALGGPSSSSTDMMIAMQRREFVKAIGMVSVSAGAALGQQRTATPDGTPQVAPANNGAIPVSPGASATATPQAAVRRAADFKMAPIPTAVPDIIAGTEAHFFSLPQFSALQKLCEILMPALNGYPAANDAGTPEFLNFLVGASPVDRQQMYRSGLDRLNADAQKRFKVPFSGVSAEQADALIRPWLETWMTNHPPTEPYKRFINVAHRDIRTATMNSQAWSAAAIAAGERAPGVSLYWSPIDPDVKTYL